MHESEGQNGQMASKKSHGSHVNRLPSRFNSENRRNALLGLILIVKTPSSTEIIIQYPTVKTRYNSISFCEVVHFFSFFFFHTLSWKPNRTHQNRNSTNLLSLGLLLIVSTLLPIQK
jgi:hypothetical protein